MNLLICMNLIILSGYIILYEFVNINTISMQRWDSV
jgi:hypothetical protein